MNNLKREADMTMFKLLVVFVVAVSTTFSLHTYGDVSFEPPTNYVVKNFDEKSVTVAAEGSKTVYKLDRSKLNVTQLRSGHVLKIDAKRIDSLLYSSKG